MSSTIASQKLAFRYRLGRTEAQMLGQAGASSVATYDFDPTLLSAEELRRVQGWIDGLGNLCRGSHTLQQRVNEKYGAAAEHLRPAAIASIWTEVANRIDAPPGAIADRVLRHRLLTLPEAEAELARRLELAHEYLRAGDLYHSSRTSPFHLQVLAKNDRVLWDDDAVVCYVDDDHPLRGKGWCFNFRSADYGYWAAILQHVASQGLRWAAVGLPGISASSDAGVYVDFARAIYPAAARLFDERVRDARAAELTKARKWVAQGGQGLHQDLIEGYRFSLRHIGANLNLESIESLPMAANLWRATARQRPGPKAAKSDGTRFTYRKSVVHQGDAAPSTTSQLVKATYRPSRFTEPELEQIRSWLDPRGEICKPSESVLLRLQERYGPCALKISRAAIARLLPRADEADVVTDDNDGERFLRLRLHSVEAAVTAAEGRMQRERAAMLDEGELRQSYVHELGAYCVLGLTDPLSLPDDEWGVVLFVPDSHPLRGTTSPRRDKSRSVQWPELFERLRSERQLLGVAAIATYGVQRENGVFSPIIQQQSPDLCIQSAALCKSLRERDLASARDRASRKLQVPAEIAQIVSEVRAKAERRKRTTSSALAAGTGQSETVPSVQPGAANLDDGVAVAPAARAAIGRLFLAAGLQGPAAEVGKLTRRQLIHRVRLHLLRRWCGLEVFSGAHDAPDEAEWLEFPPRRDVVSYLQGRLPGVAFTTRFFNLVVGGSENNLYETVQVTADIEGLAVDEYFDLLGFAPN